MAVVYTGEHLNMNPKPAIWIAIITIFLFVSIEALAQKLHPQQDQRIINSSIPVVPGSKGDVDGNGAVEILDLIHAHLCPPF